MGQVADITVNNPKYKQYSILDTIPLLKILSVTQLGKMLNLHIENKVSVKERYVLNNSLSPTKANWTYENFKTTTIYHSQMRNITNKALGLKSIKLM